MDKNDSDLLAALANMLRIRILGCIAVEARTTPEIADELGVPVDQVGQGLAVLGKAGLIRTEPGGRIRVVSDRLDQVTVTAGGPEPRAEERVPSGLRQFFRDGRLVSMPAKRSKQIDVLLVLIEDFEPGTDYPESEVNRIILQRYEDFATIRRDFIDERLMTREQGIYRRTEPGPT